MKNPGILYGVLLVLLAFAAITSGACSNDLSSKDVDTESGGDTDTDTDTDTDSDSDSNSDTGTDAATDTASDSDPYGFSVVDGYVTAGPWHGSAYAIAEGYATITPASFDGADSLCASGNLIAEYSSLAKAGFNLNQDAPAGSAVLSVVPEGDGIYVNVSNDGGTELRAVINAGSVSWCAIIESSGGVSIPWNSFNTECWDNGGTYFDGTAIDSFEVLVPGTIDGEISYNFCLLEAYPYGKVSDTDTGSDDTDVNGSCDATTTPVARHGQLRISNGQLVNQCGRPVQFAAMSLYDWNNEGRKFYNASAVQNLSGTGTGQMKGASLRIPLLSSNYPGDYSRVKTVMDACIANGIYCIINWHVIGASNVTNAKAFYVQLAKDYGDTPNIIYEPWNEPTSQSWDDIKTYMEDIIAAVRPIDPDGIFLAGTRQWCQRPDEACADPIDDPYTGYVFHYYADDHKLADFKGYIDSCLTAKKLVWTTEYGGVNAGGNGTFNVDEANLWWDYMDANLISSNNWAVETNTETSSVFTTNANSTGPWTSGEITFSGQNVFPYIAAHYTKTMSQ
ncbi:MAG: glycoside hydrolase family 5 protein [Deltaproteobacteria bacterium]|nr:glycoside hydrolase family 5 protein [Deltaproteobacteria bacterium]